MNLFFRVIFSKTIGFILVNLSNNYLMIIICYYVEKILKKICNFSLNKLKLSFKRFKAHFAVGFASRAYFSCPLMVSRITFRVWPHGAQYVRACGGLRRRSVCNFRRCAFTARPLHPGVLQNC